MSFGGLLRRLRDDAGLTQDELAETAQVSQRAISDLERGINRTAREDTAVLLAGALSLDGPVREKFVAAARWRTRQGRREAWWEIHAIGGMAGVGKTAFAVPAAHQLTGDFPDGQFFLLLHAHTPGKRPVDPADALASLLPTAGIGAAQIPPDLQARVGPVA